MNIYNLLDEWGLSDTSKPIRKFNKREVSRFTEQVDELYKKNPVPKIGSVNPGIYDSITTLDKSSDLRLNSLTNMILLSKKVWLPDPIFSAIAPSASDVWSLLPESGSSYLTSSPAISVGWEPLPKVIASQRKRMLREHLSTYVGAIIRLRKLHAIEAIGFYSWERLIAPGVEQLPNLVECLRQSGVIEAVTTRFDQNQYTLGTRLGAIGIEVHTADPSDAVKAGDRMYIIDKSPMLAYGLLNAQVTAALSCRFEPKLPGDRIIYDFVRTNGSYNGKADANQQKITIPRLSNAMFDDLASIRQDSELLAVFRELLADIAVADSAPSIECIRGELQDVASRMRENSPIKKAVGPSYIDLLLGVLGGAVGMAITGGTLAGVAAGIFAGPTTTYLSRLALSAFGGEAKQAKLKNEVVARVIERL